MTESSASGIFALSSSMIAAVAYSVTHITAFSTTDELHQCRRGVGVEPVANFRWHTAPITSVEWHPNDASVLAVSGADDQVRLSDKGSEIAQVADYGKLSMLGHHLGYGR